jgi:hypothetical protein
MQTGGQLAIWVHGPEPERGGDVEVLGDKAGNRVPEAYADGAGDRQHGDDLPPTCRGQVVARRGHGQRQDREAKPLQRTPGHEDSQTAGQRGDDSA